MDGHRLVVVSCVMFASILGLNAKTLVWYHFDEEDVGARAGRNSQVVNAASPGTYNGIVQVRKNAFGEYHSTDTAHLPVYTNGFPSAFKVADPLTKTVFRNDRALFFMSSDGNGGTGGYMPASIVTVSGSATSAELKLSTFTIEMFFRSESAANKVMRYLVYRDHSYYAKSDGNQAANRMFGLSSVNSEGKLSAYATTGYDGFSTNSYSLGSGVKVDDGNWHHVAAVFDATAQKCRLYVDYQMKKELDYKTPLDYASAAELPLTIGAPLGITYGGWHGEIDEFRLCDTALSPEQFLRIVTSEFGDDDVYFYGSFETLQLPAWTQGETMLTALYPEMAALPFNLVSDTWSQPAAQLKKTSNGQVPSVETAELPGDSIRASLTNRSSRSEVVSLHLVPNGRLGEAYNFESAFVHIADTDDHLPSDSFTAECFVKYDATTLSQLKAYNYLMFQIGAEGAFDNKVNWMVFYTNGNTPRLVASCGYLESGEYKSENIPASTKDGADLSDGKWHHVAYVYDKTESEVRFYVDYRLWGSKSGVTLLSGKPSGSNYKNIEIGTGYGGGSNHQMNGWLDEIRITRRALNPQEFLTTIPVADGKTLFWAPLDEDYKVAPYAEVSPAGAVIAATAELTGRQAKVSYQEGDETIKKTTGASIALTGGKVDFGRNLMLESERSVTVEFLAKLTAAGGSAATVLSFKNGQGDTIWSIPAASIPLNGWHSVALKVDATAGTQTLMVDGVVVSEEVRSLPESLADSSFVLGDDGVSGFVDEVRISKGVLGSTELFKLIRNGLILIFQ